MTAKILVRLKVNIPCKKPSAAVVLKLAKIDAPIRKQHRLITGIELQRFTRRIYEEQLNDDRNHQQNDRH